MQRRWIALIALLCIVIPPTGPILSDIASAEESYEAGYVEWEGKNVHNIYLSGPYEEVGLTRDYQGKSMGNAVIRSGVDATIGPIEMPPLEMGINGVFNISTYIASFVQGGPGAITLQCRPAGSINPYPVTIETQVKIGNFTYFGSVTDYVYESSAEAHNLSTEVMMANISAQEGEIITYTMTASTQCPHSINLEWGGTQQFSGGIILRGELFTPEIEITVDDAHLAHIQFIATLPWGFDDLDDGYTSMNIYGPVPSDQKKVFDKEKRVQAFPPGSLTIPRTDDLGRMSRVYTGVNELPSGDNVLMICLKTIDSQNLNDKCDHEGLVRFNVEEDEETMASAFLWLSISGFVAVIGYMFSLFRKGTMLPLPLIGALILMAILMIPLASDIPDLGGETNITDDARAPSFILHQNENGSSVSLDELLDGHDAVIIGITLPASSNAIDQSKQIENALNRLEGRASAVQIVTGENVRMDDLDKISNLSTTDWPVLIDDGQSRFAKRMPLGASDSIVIIDSSGHVTYSKEGSASAEDMTEAIEEISTGGEQSVFDSFGLLWGPGLAMLLVALPRKSYETPEEAVFPGSHWGSIAIVGGLGFFMVNLTSLLLPLLSFDNDFRTWVDIALMVWFVSAAIRAAIRGTPWEVRFLSKRVHNLFSKEFRKWKEIEDVERDLLIGFWMGWFIWLAFPALLSQGVTAVILTGGWGYLFGPLILIAHILAAGILTLIIRLVASWGGPLSRAFGSFGSGPFSQALGWALVPISLWALANSIIHAQNIGLI